MKTPCTRILALLATTLLTGAWFHGSITPSGPELLPLPSGGDDTATINATLSDAGSRGVYAPAGYTWKHSGVINVTSTCLFGDGDSSIFLSTNTTGSSPQNAIELSGTNPCLIGVAVQNSWTGGRQSNPQSDAVHVVNASNYRIEQVSVTGSASGGIFQENSGPGIVFDNRIKNTLADSIGVYSQSHDVTVSDNYIENSGDDALSCVSYSGDATQGNNVLFEGNRVNGGLARGVAIVGCSLSVATSNKLSTITDSCLYVAYESGTGTKVPNHVLLTGNMCDTVTTIASGYAAAMMAVGTGTNDVSFQSNTITNALVGSCFSADSGTTHVVQANTACDQ